jgi:hypothetical protein
MNGIVDELAEVAIGDRRAVDPETVNRRLFRIMFANGTLHCG